MEWCAGHKNNITAYLYADKLIHVLYILKLKMFVSAQFLVKKLRNYINYNDELI